MFIICSLTYIDDDVSLSLTFGASNLQCSVRLPVYILAVVDALFIEVIHLTVTLVEHAVVVRMFTPCQLYCKCSSLIGSTSNFS